MLRKITSLTSFLTFIVSVVTSVVLYVVPHGRVANWADWTFWGMSKDDWGATHTTVGTLFFIALLLHLWLNWKPLMAYMKNRAREMVVMTVPMVISLALTVYVFAGTLMGLPPMQQLLDYSTEIKESATEVYGNPPYGHAEDSSLKKFCGYLGFDQAEAMAALEKAGYVLERGEQSVIKDIARTRNVSPQQVFDDIRNALGGDPFSSLPATPPEGLGKLKLSDLCASFGLDLNEAMARLEAKSFAPAPDLSIKDIAAKADAVPRDVYAALRGE
jgi:hypothetical protein